MNNLTIFIITCSEESLKECMGSIEKQRPRNSFNIETIKNIYPMSEAFNEMHRRCDTPYFIQVDADVILNADAVDTLYQNIKNSRFFIYATYGQLYEEGFGLGGSVRCWKKNIFNLFKFRDVRTVDRDFYRRTRLFGFYRKNVHKILGVHKPRHSDFSDYHKTKGDIEKWQFLRRPFAKYALGLYENLTKEPHKNRYKILGFSLGALSSKKRIYKSKDIYIEKERLNSIFEILSADFNKFDLKKDIYFPRLLDILKKSYCNYSTVNKKILMKEAFKELFNAGLDTNHLERLYHIITL